MKVAHLIRSQFQFKASMLMLSGCLVVAVLAGRAAVAVPSRFFVDKSSVNAALPNLANKVAVKPPAPVASVLLAAAEDRANPAENPAENQARAVGPTRFSPPRLPDVPEVSERSGSVLAEPIGEFLPSNSLAPPRNQNLRESLQSWFGIEEVQPGRSLIAGNNAGNNQNGRIELPAAERAMSYCQSLLQSSVVPAALRALPGSALRLELIAGELPSGVRVDDQTDSICGTPTALGTFDFSVSLTYSDQLQRVLQYRLVVREAAILSQENGELQIITKSLPVALVGGRYLANIVATGGKAPYRFQVTGLPAGFVLDRQAGVISGQSSSEFTGMLSVEVTDANAKLVVARLTLNVRAAPLSLSTVSVPEIKVGETVAFTFSATGGAPPYSWQLLSGALPKGMQFGAALGELSGAASAVGETRLRIQVSDRQGASDAAEFRLAIKASKLEILSKSLAAAIPNESYQAKLEARGGNPPYLWRAVTALPDNFSLSPLGLLAGATDSEWTRAITFEVTDTNGEAISRELSLISALAALRIETAELAEANLCGDYAYPLAVTGGKPPYTFQLFGQSSGPSASQSIANPELQIDGAGVIHGKPSRSQNLRVVVADANANSTSRDFSLRVADSTLKLESGASTACQVGNPCSPSLVISGGCAPLQFQVAAGALPSGLSMSSEGIFGGVPTAVGDFVVDLRVSDIRQVAAVFPVAINVTAASLEITTGTLSPGRVGEDYYAALEARGGEPPYIWGSEGQGLPAGFALDSRTGEILGRPTSPANFAISFVLVDARGRDTRKRLAVSIQPTHLRIEGATTAQAAVGETQTIMLRAVGGQPPYSWQLAPATSVATLAAQGDSAELRVSPEELTALAIPVQVQDANADFANHSVVIDVQPAALRVVTTSPLPAARVAEPYLVEIMISGGRAPYQFSLPAGALPSGLTLNPTSGIVSGSPLEEMNDVPFVLMVRDQDGREVNSTFEISVTGDGRGAVTQLIARGSDGKVGLLWRNPNEPDLIGVRVLRKLGGSPQSIDDGTVVYSGSETIALDETAPNDQQCFYAAFAVFSDGVAVSPHESGRAVAMPQSVSVSGARNPFADSVPSFNPLTTSCFGCDRMPQVVLGAPRGGGEFNGSTDVVSLGARVNADSGSSAPYGGSITLSFDDNIVVNGNGVDFTIFENVFRAGQTSRFWLEPAIVEVSADGVQFYRFPIDYVPHFDEQGRVDANNQASFPRGFAGIRPVFANGANPSPVDPNLSGGDSFDLGDLLGVNLPWIRFVRITSTGDSWLRDPDGDLVRHSNESPTFSASGTGNSGFDLDAIAAVHY